MINYTDFFELISTDKELPVAAVFMTYGFDAELFERHILPAFLGVIGNADDNELRFRNQIALRLNEIPVTVLSDGKQYSGGRTFLYDHITVSDQTFHPKCYLLLYQNFLRVIIGSCNITKAGLCYNAETVWYEDITADKPSHVIDDLRDIVIWMSESYGIKDNEALKEILKYLFTCRSNSNHPKLLSTINKESAFHRFFDELSFLNEDCKEVSILSPFYENDRDRAIEKSLLMEFADEFKNIYPKAKIGLYFPAIRNDADKNYKVTAPVNIFFELCSKYKDTELYVIHREWDRDKEDSVPRTLHAKLIIVEFNNGNKMILSGSINFTNNAMRSRIGSLRNIEIGVLEYGSIKFIMPKSTKVGLKDLSYKDKEVIDLKLSIFVNSAVLDGSRLTVLMKEEQSIPFKVEYQNHIIYVADRLQRTVIIDGFHLHRSQDIHIICENYDFYIPIQILHKEEYVSEDLKLAFKLEMQDIVDYLAGRYKSLSEIGRFKQLSGGDSIVSVDRLTIYFRHNLQRFYKAMDSLKQGLESPYYSNMAFKNYLCNPIGIKNLVNLIIKDYKQGIAGNEETFFLLAEIENVIIHLQYPEDRLGKDFKDKELKRFMAESMMISKEIYIKSKKKIRDQYDILLETYGLEVR